MHVSITTGMSIEQVREQFDIPRLKAFNSYTEKYPPQHLLIASYFGFPKEKAKQADDATLAGMMAEFQQVQR